ncbi:ABC transporter permease [Mycetocola reblochoni]|uniref:Pyrimidine ABC transporter, transmembrane component 1 n=2 Tax=Mycetocola reblochoni TaxID=331618 RepID=A0A1R4ITU6_9MICO|nr:ABC transporter permease subunit [Mycetocola reblochoni]RLP71044.1 ABC transporter permease subunit [Mycetocola reblochoni]SJN23282.1 Pyrimidine ABC transporter, transmembrane component 1 [Mycetocola reblochoni REB411]
MTAATAVPSAPVVARRRGLPPALASALPPLVLVVVALLLWELAVRALEIPAFLLPAPSAIGAEFARLTPQIVEASVATGTNALLGLVISAVVAVLLAIAASGARVVDGMLAPVVVALAVVPIAAVAPVFYIMFGSSSETGRVIVVAIAVFVPVFVNALRGLRQVSPVHRELLRALNITGWRAVRTVTVPTALPFVFTGLRQASSLAVISALVSEYFGGPKTGIGSQITTAASGSNYAQAWAFVLGAIVTGLAFYLVTLALERVVSRHRPSP